MKPLLWVTTDYRLMRDSLNVFFDTGVVTKHSVCASQCNYSCKWLPRRFCTIFHREIDLHPISSDWRATYIKYKSIRSYQQKTKQWFRGLYFTHWWTWGTLKAIWSSFTSNPLDSDRTWTSRGACWAALPPSSLGTLLPPVSNLQNRLTTSTELDSGHRSVGIGGGIRFVWTQVSGKAETA